MAEENFPKWERLPNGNLRVLPVLGFEMGIFAPHVVMRLESEDETGAPRFHQLILPASAAQDLAQALSRNADRALGKSGPRSVQ